MRSASDHGTRTGARLAPADPSGRRSVEARHELVELLREAAVHSETAVLLDRRAGGCASPPLAAVLRERATAHRRRAARIRAELARQGVGTTVRRPPGGAP